MNGRQSKNSQRKINDSRIFEKRNLRTLIKMEERSLALFPATNNTELKEEFGRFTGQYDPKKKVHFGTLKQKDGSILEGSFNIDGTLNPGKKILADGTVLHGKFINGMLEGLGQKIKADGTILRGNFAAGVLNGWGNKTTVDGTIYRGNFKCDKLHGEGEKERHFKFVNKESYEIDFVSFEKGQFENDLLEGNGFKILKRIDMISEGKKIRKNRDSGVAFVNKGKKYKIDFLCEYSVGQFSKGKLNGKGEHWDNDTNFKSKGKFDDDVLNGEGSRKILSWKNWDERREKLSHMGCREHCWQLFNAWDYKEKGFFINGKLNGKGSIWDTKFQRSFHGDFVDGLLEGVGVLNSYEAVYEGVFEKTRLVSGKITWTGEKLKNFAMFSTDFSFNANFKWTLRFELPSKGIICEGTFIDGWAISGLGKMKYPNGDTVEGYFAHNKLVGEYTKRMRSGSIELVHHDLNESTIVRQVMHRNLETETVCVSQL